MNQASRDPTPKEGSSTGSDRNLFDLVKNSLQLAGLTSALFYGVLWLAYYQFYSNFALTPEEAGLGRVELISQALVGPIVLLVLFTILATIFFTGVTIYNILTASVQIIALFGALYIYSRVKRSLRPKVSLAQMKSRIKGIYAIRHPRAMARRIAILSLVAGLVALLFGLYTRASEAVETVQQGRAVQDLYLEIGPIHVPLLSIRAQPVAVMWKSQGGTPDIIKADANCIMLLGKTKDELILYDYRRDYILRLASSDANVMVKRALSELDEKCKKSTTL